MSSKCGEAPLIIRALIARCESPLSPERGTTGERHASESESRSEPPGSRRRRASRSVKEDWSGHLLGPRTATSGITWGLSAPRPLGPPSRKGPGSLLLQPWRSEVRLAPSSRSFSTVASAPESVDTGSAEVEVKSRPRKGQRRASSTRPALPAGSVSSVHATPGPFRGRWKREKGRDPLDEGTVGVNDFGDPKTGVGRRLDHQNPCL